MARGGAPVPGLWQAALAALVAAGASIEGDASPGRDVPRKRLPAGAPLLHGPLIPTKGEDFWDYGGVSLSAHARGQLRIAYQIRGREAAEGIYTRMSTDGGYTWGTLARMDDVPGGVQSLTPNLLRAPGIEGCAWKSNLGAGVSRIRYTRLDGIHPSARVDSDAYPGARPAFPKLAYLDGVLVCAWTHTLDDPAWAVLVARSLDEGAAWEETYIDTLVGPGSFPAVAASPRGFFFLNHYRNAEERGVLYRAGPSGAGWLRVAVPEHPGHRPRDRAFAVAPDGTLGMGFSSSPEDDLTVLQMYASFSGDDGMTWSAPVRVSRDDAFVHAQPQLAAGPSGAWHLAWRCAVPWSHASHGQYARRLGDGSWTEPILLNEPADEVAPGYTNFAIDVDAAGHVYVMWGHRNAGDSSNDDLYIKTSRSRPYDPLDDIDFTRLRVLGSPSRAGQTLVIPSEARAIADVRLFDVQGRLVHRWREIPIPRGLYTLEWNARRESGTPAGAGVYLWDVTLRGERVTRLRAKGILLGR